MADDRLACSRLPSIAATNAVRVVPRSRAISFKLSQNWSSRLTLVLWPTMTVERFVTEDFTASLSRRDEIERGPCLTVARIISTCGRNNTVNGKRLRVISSSLSGDRGKTAAAAEGPWSDPLANAPSRGSHNLVLPEPRKPAQALYTGSDGSVLTATPV